MLWYIHPTVCLLVRCFQVVFDFAVLGLAEKWKREDPKKNPWSKARTNSKLHLAREADTLTTAPFLPILKNNNYTTTGRTGTWRIGRPLKKTAKWLTRSLCLQICTCHTNLGFGIRGRHNLPQQICRLSDCRQKLVEWHHLKKKPAMTRVKKSVFLLRLQNDCCVIFLLYIYFPPLFIYK